MGVSHQLEKAGLNATASEACQGVKRRVVLRRPKRIAMKRNRSQDRIRRGPRRSYGIVRRVKTLKRLVPSAKSKSRGLNGLFTDTADYILSLQMRVRVMQIMVQVLSSGSQE